MSVRHVGWRQIANRKTRETTGLATLRWTLLRHVTQSLDQIDDEQIKRNVLRQEMLWLHDYWAQPIPQSHISLKYWRRLFEIKSLNTRRDLYE